MNIFENKNSSSLGERPTTGGECVVPLLAAVAVLLLDERVEGTTHSANVG